jgi:hypothetical protein
MEGAEQMGHEGLKQWREDMKARDATRAKSQLMAMAAAGNVPAARKLYEESTKKPVGRPKKDSEAERREDNVAQLHKQFFKGQRD